MKRHLSLTPLCLLASTLAFAPACTSSDANSLGTPNARPGASPSAQPSGGTAAGTATPTPPAAGSALDPLNRAAAANLAHHINQLEIQQAQNSTGILQSQAVQSYAQTLIQDHTTSDQALVTLASGNTENITLLGLSPSTEELATQDQLSRLSGSDYDQGFLLVQYQGHLKALHELQDTRTMVTDQALGAYLDDLITHVQSHLQMAASLINGGAAPAASPSPSPSASASPSATPSSTPSATPAVMPTMR
jgi:putative membrane protein